ncbi:MAG: polyribonucleotide nucleotidyltransferase [Chloroflexota bacterium]
MLENRSFECNIGGRSLIIESGKLAGQASASVTIRYGETVVLVTLGISDKPREGTDFLPLTVDYEERLYAAGKIPGGFIRREGRPSEKAILTCRLTDRPLRSLLPKSWRRDIQVVTTVLSADQENDPDILSIIGGSVVLMMSEIPFAGPVGAVRIGYINDEFVVNPTLPQLEESQLELVVASTKDAVVMVEAGAKEASEELMLKALKLGHEVNQTVIELQEKVREALGQPKAAVPEVKENEALAASVANVASEKLAALIKLTTKQAREKALDGLKKELIESLGETFSEAEILAMLDKKLKAALRNSILHSGERLGGRALTEIRPLSAEVSLLPRTHGSGLFTRGQTQVLTITTLGSIRKEQQLDGLGIEETKRFMHHYNFPPFSSGEVKRLGSPSRREIGHGALVERAIEPILPEDEGFPYTIRLVSEVLSSNGSTSMASVCASSLSLMDAGIPIKRPVAGIAMGLITGEDGRYAVLTDIEGAEDAYGDMDFKVAGTTEGITALQLDIKIKGLVFDIISKTLAQAKDARLHILGAMGRAIGSSRPELSQYAPRMYRVQIDPEKIGAVIGPGGRTIRAITEQTKTTIDVENDGTVFIGSPNQEKANRAMEIIKALTREVEVGDTFTGKVTRVMNFGAMVEMLPGKEGLIRISELDNQRVGRVEDAVNIGDEVTVKVIEIDNMGRVNLSRRAMLPGYTGDTGEGPAAPERERPPFRERNSPGSGGGFRRGPPNRDRAPYRRG